MNLFSQSKACFQIPLILLFSLTSTSTPSTPSPHLRALSHMALTTLLNLLLSRTPVTWLLLYLMCTLHQISIFSFSCSHCRDYLTRLTSSSFRRNISKDKNSPSFHIPLIILGLSLLVSLADYIASLVP